VAAAADSNAPERALAICRAEAAGTRRTIFYTIGLQRGRPADPTLVISPAVATDRGDRAVEVSVLVIIIDLADREVALEAARAVVVTDLDDPGKVAVTVLGGLVLGIGPDDRAAATDPVGPAIGLVGLAIGPAGLVIAQDGLGMAIGLAIDQTASTTGINTTVGAATAGPKSITTGDATGTVTGIGMAATGGDATRTGHGAIRSISTIGATPHGRLS
jgi:hypothetical protein